LKNEDQEGSFTLGLSLHLNFPILHAKYPYESSRNIVLHTSVLSGFWLPCSYPFFQPHESSVYSRTTLSTQLFLPVMSEIYGTSKALKHVFQFLCPNFVLLK